MGHLFLLNVHKSFKDDILNRKPRGQTKTAWTDTLLCLCWLGEL